MKHLSHRTIAIIVALLSTLSLALAVISLPHQAYAVDGTDGTSGTNSTSQGSDGDSAPIAGPVPNIIVTNFTYGGDSVAAGADFNLDFTFQNKGQVAVTNMVVTVDGGAYTGAIAGDVDEDSSVTGCLFTHETLGAIDGISYAGKAEPAAFDVLCAGDTVPKTFSQMELTFRADGKVVAVVPFQYGRGIDSLPEIPAKKGFSAVWPALDYTHLTASQTLDAVYTPYTSSLTDDTQTLPQILVDGSFSSQATVSHTSEPVSWTDAKGTARTGTAVTVTVDDPDMTAISYTVHYRLPEDGKRYDLWVKTESGWEKQDSTVDGSYLLFTSDRETVTFCVQERTASPLLWVLLAVLILLALMLVVIRIRKKRGRQTIRSRLRKARQKKS